MAKEFYGYFDSTPDDERDYNEEDLSRGFRIMCNTGVKTLAGDNLKVAPDSSGLNTRVNYGGALITGFPYELFDDGGTPMVLEHAFASTYPRIDRVVLQLDLSTDVRRIAVMVKQGVESANPVPPALTREGLIYELSLAQCRVNLGATVFTVANITDERADESLCGNIRRLPTPAEIGAVPTSRKVGGKALTSDITLADMNAVPTSRKVNGYALSSDITIPATAIPGALTPNDFLQANRIVYVNASAAAGGTGTAAAPFKTVQDAIDSLPRKSIGAFTVTINIAAGSYTEDVSLSNFDYTVTLSAAATSVIVGSVTVTSCSEIQVLSNMTLNGRGTGLSVNDSTVRLGTAFAAGGGSGTGIIVTNGGAVLAASTGVEVSLKGYGAAVQAYLGSRVFLGMLTGSGNTTGIQSDTGSTCAYYTIAAGFATTMYASRYGGRIYTGAQANVPSY